MERVAEAIDQPDVCLRHVIRFVEPGDPLEASPTAPDTVKPGQGLHFERFDHSLVTGIAGRS